MRWELVVMSTPWPKFTSAPMSIGAVASRTQPSLMKQSGPMRTLPHASRPPMTVRLDMINVRSPTASPHARKSRARSLSRAARRQQLP